MFIILGRARWASESDEASESDGASVMKNEFSGIVQSIFALSKARVRKSNAQKREDERKKKGWNKERIPY